MEWIAPIISAIGVIIVGWFTYNQHTKNKMTEYKIEKWKKEEEAKSSKHAEKIAKIYGELWRLLHELGCDRVYIIQPHPLVDNVYVSITIEVRRNGVVSMKQEINRMEMCDIALFCSKLATNDFMFYKDIAEEMRDKKAKSILSSNGAQSVIIKRLGDDKYEWIGSLVCDFAKKTELSPDFIKGEMMQTACNIQYMLPEYKEGK